MIERRALLPASPEEVWAALTESGELSRWFGGSVELDPSPGGRVTVDTPAGIRRGLVEELEPPHRLSFRWLPDLGARSPRTRVEFVLEEVTEGTLLTVVESPLWAAPPLQRGRLEVRVP